MTVKVRVASREVGYLLISCIDVTINCYVLSGGCHLHI
jgi:hypothetical protein